MAENDQGDRTEEATPQRREDFRRRGQVAQTRELASVMMLFGCALMIWFLGRHVITEIHSIFSHTFGADLVAAVRSGDYIQLVQFVMREALMIVAPIFAILIFLSVSSSVLQIGFLVSEDALGPNFDRINPWLGFQRLASLKGLVEGIKAFAKVILVGLVALSIIKSELKIAPFLIQWEVGEVVSHIGTVITRLLFAVGVVMGALAGFDYIFLRWDLEKQMRMTKQELKDEHKMREGDPLVRARIRRLQREMANKRMMSAVPKADVIVTNPTHIAVALKYDAIQMIAPKVLAMGAGLIAEKIKSLAKESRIPIVENKPLARTIYKTMKVGQFIPRQLYAAVAEVLAYVYKLKKKLKQG